MTSRNLQKILIFSIHSLDVDGGSNTDIAYYAALLAEFPTMLFTLSNRKIDWAVLDAK